MLRPFPRSCMPYRVYMLHCIGDIYTYICYVASHAAATGSPFAFLAWAGITSCWIRRNSTNRTNKAYKCVRIGEPCARQCDPCERCCVSPACIIKPVQATCRVSRASMCETCCACATSDVRLVALLACERLNRFHQCARICILCSYSTVLLFVFLLRNQQELVKPVRHV